MKCFSDKATVPSKKRTHLLRKIGILFSVMLLTTLLSACNSGQESPAQSDGQMKTSSWQPQEIVLKDGIPYTEDAQGNLNQLGEAILPPTEWEFQDLAGRNEATTLEGNPDVQGELVTQTSGWLVVTYTRGDTYVYRTEDGGCTWTETNAPDLVYVPGVVGFINEDRLIIAEKLFAGAPVFITKDGGESWEQIEMPDELAEVKSIDVTGEKIIMSAQNGDEEWEITSFDLGDTWSITQSLQ